MKKNIASTAPKNNTNLLNVVKRSAANNDVPIAAFI